MPVGRKRIFRLLVRGIFILLGLYGGWRLAGALNDHRSDVPRPVPTTHASGSSTATQSLTH
jgi:hypothetical protein